MDAPESKLELIRKLLAKAERSATPAEADAYNEKAAALMARHGVDAAMLAAAERAPQDVIGSQRFAMTDPYSREKATLAADIARAMGCKAIWHRGHRGVAAVTVFGFDSDRQRVEMTFTSLLLQATRAVVHQRPAWGDQSVAAFRRSWLLGFSAVVHHRLRAANERAVAEHDARPASTGTSAALVLADRAQRVDHAYAEQWGHLRKTRRRNLSGSGYQAGAEAGRRADINGPRIGTDKRALDR